MSLSIADIETAISKVQGGQSYQVGDFRYTRADLDALLKLRSIAQAETAESNKTMMTLAKFHKAE